MKNRIVITGAGGFLGGRTAKFMAEYYTEKQVIATSRRKNRISEFAAYQCEFIPGDLLDKEFCEKLTVNTEIVIHCAALSAPFGNYNSFYDANFIATKTLLDASVKNGVEKFIFISTPSIYFNFQNRFNVKENDILPKKLVNYYATTKLLAEQYVLQANEKGIQTIALRPRAIIGAEDTVIFPRIIEAYKNKKLKVIGNGKNSCDFTCVRNVIEAIICSINSPKIAYGQAYNITDGTPLDFWETLNYALTELNFKPISKKVPYQLALCAASILEWRSKSFQNNKEPVLTKYGVGILAKSMTLDISKAKKILKYIPIMSTREGINEYIKWHKIQN